MHNVCVGVGKNVGGCSCWNQIVVCIFPSHLSSPGLLEDCLLLFIFSPLNQRLSVFCRVVYVFRPTKLIQRRGGALWLGFSLKDYPQHIHWLTHCVIKFSTNGAQSRLCPNKISVS